MINLIKVNKKKQKPNCIKINFKKPKKKKTSQTHYWKDLGRLDFLMSPNCIRILAYYWTCCNFITKSGFLNLLFIN